MHENRFSLAAVTGESSRLTSDSVGLLMGTLVRGLHACHFLRIGGKSFLQGRLGRHGLDCRNVTRQTKFIIRGADREFLKKKELQGGCLEAFLFMFLSLMCVSS